MPPHRLFVNAMAAAWLPSWWVGAPVLLGIACTSTTDEEQPEVDFSAFDTEMEAILAEYDLEGASVAIVHREAGLVHERAFGEWEVDRRSVLASASKVLSAGVLAHLDDGGLVDLDAPISTYVGHWGERDHGHDPSLVQLLSNSSGMLGLLDDPAYVPYLCMIFNRTTLEECGRSVYTARDADVTMAPDTEFRYGGAQWQLAGAIAEEVSGKTWNRLVHELYVEPCGLEELTYGMPSEIMRSSCSRRRAEPIPRMAW